MPIWQSHSGGAFAPRKFACLHKQPGRRANRGRFEATCNLPREGPWIPGTEQTDQYPSALQVCLVYLLQISQCQLKVLTLG